MLPTIPTDNLAKFLAVAGLVLAGASWWWAGEVQDRLQAAEVVAREQYIEFVAEMETRFNVMASMVAAKTAVRVRLAAPGADGELTPVSAGVTVPIIGDGEHRENYRSRIAHYDGFLASCQPAGPDRHPAAESAFPPEAVKELRAKLRAHGSAVENLWRQDDALKLTRLLCGAGVAFGLPASAVGFFGWRRGQKRADEAERLKLIKDAQEVEKAKLPPVVFAADAPQTTPALAVGTAAAETTKAPDHQSGAGS